jgi:cytochrome c peroxidase
MKAKPLVFIIMLCFIVGTVISGLAFKGFASKTADDSISFKVPANFPAPVYRFKDNPVTANGFRLGRALFYDVMISKDKSIACANCHQPFAAFAQLDHPVSHGVDDCQGTRNTPALFNLAWQKDFMWDGGVNHIEVSPLNAMTNPCEMASDLKTIVSRLQNSPAYPAMFQAAFGTTQVNSQRVFRALAQFTGMLVSAGSKYDQVSRHENNAVFTADEAVGYALFKQNCSTCHQEPLFTDRGFRNNGLDALSDDIGRDSITHQEKDRAKFRVPSLRNIELSSPYMHDGRFNTLKQVLAHYSNGVKNNANLDPLLRNNGKLGIALRAKQQEQVIAFLKTLTDRDFVNDRRFQEPKWE